MCKIMSADEIIIAKLIFQIEEMEKHTFKLVRAYEEVALQNLQKEKRVAQLTHANRNLIKSKENLKEYIKVLEEKAFML